MKKYAALICFSLVIICLTQTALSQSVDDSSQKKYEVGGQFTHLNRVDADAANVAFQNNYPGSVRRGPASISELGFGGRLTYNFTKNIALEAEANFFPDDKRSHPVLGVPIRIIEPGGRKFQAVFGPKVGYRSNKFGIYGKFRPGLIRIDRFEAVIQIGPPSNFFVLSETRKGLTFFNIDFGGVFEYYPSRKTVLRVDVGDTIIRYGPQEPKAINPTITHHNLQISTGFAFRF